MAQWNHYDAGIGNVGSYQVSGHPFITGSSLAAGSEKKVSFPFVTKTITVMQSASAATDLRIHFAATGSGNVVSGKHYIVLRADKENIEMNMKCKELWLSCPASNTVATEFVLHASLTRIHKDRMWVLTGSGITD